ncbi:cell division protein PerM [Actinosynnema sp. CS-041913]|uniref:cell division protein PerM n=1 Tax=Actinosynnema sp. CS-041913 TaxID=3239917 RepID=UPI003D91C399
MPVLQSPSHGAVTDSVRPPEFSRAERARVLAMTAAGSVVVSYAAVAAVLALVSSTAAHAQFSTTGVLSASAPAWLVAHHVPLRFDGGQLGVLPLLPTVLLMLLVSRAAAGAADRLGLFEPLQARGVVFSIAGAHAVVGGVIAFLMGDGGVVRATPAVAFFGCAAVSGVAAVAGVAQRCGLVEVVFERIDPVARRGLRAGALALFALTAAGALLLAFGLLVSWPLTSSLFDQAGGTLGTGLGIWLMCLAYLPNAVVGAMSYVVGSGFSIGAVTISPTVFVGGPVPAVPLLAALPEQQSGLLPLVLILPGVVGVLVGLSLRDAAETPRARVRAVLVAAVTGGVGTLVLAAVAGGNLGGGVFNPVTIPAGLLAVLTVGWIAVPGAVVAWFAGARPAPVVEPEPEAVDVAEDDLEEDDLSADDLDDLEEDDLGEDDEDFDDYDDEEEYEDEFEELAEEAELEEEEDESDAETDAESDPDPEADPDLADKRD